MESAMSRNLGFEIESEEDIRKDAFLFGEAQGRIVVSVPEAKQAEFIEIAATSAIEYTLLGTVTAGDILIDDRPNNGAKDFEGNWIQFGSEEFPDWESILKHLHLV